MANPLPGCIGGRSIACFLCSIRCIASGARTIRAAGPVISGKSRGRPRGHLDRIAAMFHIATGSQRRTIVLGPLAIKVPRLRRLRAGLRANREEGRIWREGWQRFFPELCPVIASLPFGVAVIMPAVEIMSAHPVSVTEDQTLVQVADLFEDRYITRVPVVRNKKLVGILARRDLLFGYMKASKYWS